MHVPTQRSNALESISRDFRGRALPNTLPQHTAAVTSALQADYVTHMCPECPAFAPRPFCEICLGAGNITTDRLDRYQRQHQG